ncbi:hypothetical protein AYO43_10020 [Nitrospira sp. SCGC AG-212-E16]|nr:hypothetical protein AYO43_10020 [Nitrospira sp. SCGC AG-212-E16]
MEWRWQGDHAEAEARNPRIDKVISSRPPCLPGLKDIGQFTHVTLALFQPIENIRSRLTWERVAQFSCFGSVFLHSVDLMDQLEIMVIASLLGSLLC